jgi:tetratricopeptide (TPR) repeat protein
LGAGVTEEADGSRPVDVANHSSVDPAALALALGHSGTLDPRAAAFLEKQGRLSDEQIKVAGAQELVLRLQAEDLKREDRLRHWSLRVRHVSDVLKVAFEIAIAFIVLSVATGIGAAIWTASHDDGLVIESFSVPPDMAARGLSGEVVAGQLLDKLVQMQAATGSNRPAKSYANNWGNDIKVQIPDTGISAGEAYRFLSQWLGHQTHISGEVFRNASGITVTARVAGDGAATFSGTESNLDALVQRAAEQVYERTQPYRFAIYEDDKGSVAPARAALQRLVTENSGVERAWAEVGLSTIEENEVGGDAYAALRYLRVAVVDGPDLGIARSDLAGAESTFGHDEARLAAIRANLDIIHRGMISNPRCAAVNEPLSRGIIAAGHGEYRDAAALYAEAMRLPGCSGGSEIARTSLPIALGLQHDLTAARANDDGIVEPPSPATNRVDAIETAQDRRVAGLWLDFVLSDWPAIKNATAEYAKLLPTLGGEGTMTYRTLGTSMLALATARMGHVPGGEAEISATPLDCYFCVRARGQIAALDKRWSDSERWFAVATKLAPMLPFAWSEWGETLLAHGNIDGAISKFTLAHQMGPHFADPLELWGEALMQKNRSDLALAKFEEAEKYAPRWGRLHLKWGEALSYLGRKDEAAAQFQEASRMDLIPTEQSRLAADAALGRH